jgi:single-strand DNA-binding protein
MADTQTVLVGNLTADPELRVIQSGVAVANLRLAVTPRVKDGDQWRDGETSYFSVTCWRDLAEHVADSLHKGARVVVAGRLRQRSWETPEVEADEIGPSLRWATVKVSRAARDGGGREPARAGSGGRSGGWANDDTPF